MLLTALYLPTKLPRSGDQKKWLEAIEHPDWTKTTLAFRGVDYSTDKTQRRQTPQGEIFGFMSTMLTANQGSYTRRLRSLSTNRINNGDLSVGAIHKLPPSVGIVNQMIQHASDPRASSFISFTYMIGTANVYSAATRFVRRSNGTNKEVPNGGFLAVQMDSRRLFSNIASQFNSEMELLAPLIVFPDEVLVYKEGFGRSPTELAALLEGIFKKTGRDFRGERFTDENGERYFERHGREGHSFMGQIFGLANAQSRGACSGIFM